MTLASSGTMSIGGTTTDRSINLELGRSATATSSLGETDLRSLAGVSSGTISISDFYGASLYDWTVTITLGSTTYFGQTFQGYGSVGNPSSPTTWGSVTDASCDLYSTNPTWAWYAVNNSSTKFYIYDNTGTPTGNAGWTTCDIYLNQQDTSGSPDFTRTRSSLTYTLSGSTRFWDMNDYGQTNGAFSSPSNNYATLGFK